MKTIINFFKFIIFSLVFAFAVILGSFIYKLDIERQNLKKGDDGLHRICRSHLEGKIAGKPCSMCRLKWAEIKSPKSFQDKIIEYAERKFGKKVEDFTNSETLETFNMMFE
jgi:hypothetical protein